MLKSGLIMHLGVTLVWLLLMRGGVPTVVIGWIIGWGFLFVLRDLLGIQTYVQRLNGFVIFIGVLARELLLANLRLAILILTASRESMHPDFLHYDISGLSDAEVYLLSQCITLTPGTTAIDIDGDTLLIHAFDASDPEQVCRDIDRTLRNAILRFTR